MEFQEKTLWLAKNKVIDKQQNPASIRINEEREKKDMCFDDCLLKRSEIAGLGK